MLHQRAENGEVDRVSAAAPLSNRYDRMEWAGAFGDLGTLIPFVIAYIDVVGMEPCGILFAFGVSLIFCGAYYRTPIPVQPMKAAGAVALTQTVQGVAVTPAVVLGAGISTGIIWLLLGSTRTARRIAAFVPRHVVIGIVLGLGLALMLEGVRMMATEWAISVIGLIFVLLFSTNRSLPAMFILLLYGVGTALIAQPVLLQELAKIPIEFRMPSFALPEVGWRDYMVGLAFLALPQLPLTLGNAIVGTAEENNRLFPDRPTDENRLAKSTGYLNLFGGAFGGIPMCHGAGGMAGHVAFGARTGGATILLGVVLLLLALFLSDSVRTLFATVPKSVLGVILFITGAQLALNSWNSSPNKAERFITLITAVFCIGNVGVGFVVGMVGAYLNKRGLLRI